MLGVMRAIIHCVLPRLVRPMGKVIAFEPSPVTFGALSRNIRRHGLSNVKLERKAVTNRTGQVLFHYGEYSVKDSTVASFREDEHTTVDCVSLDDYLGSIGVRHVDLVKIDVEGAEVEVLAGGRLLFERPESPWIIAEFCPELLEAAGHRPSRLVELLFELGFKVSEIRRTGTLIPLETYGSVEKFVSSVSRLTNLFAQKAHSR
jgi:FkbM family methyltransferase